MTTSALSCESQEETDRIDEEEVDLEVTHIMAHRTKEGKEQMTPLESLTIDGI